MKRFQHLFKDEKWQALIPGWNIIYMLKYGAEMRKKWKRQDQELLETEQEGQGLQILVRHYVDLAKKAESAGDFDKATEYHAQARAEIGQYFEDHRESIIEGFQLLIGRSPEFRDAFTSLYGLHLDDFLKDKGIDDYLD